MLSSILKTLYGSLWKVAIPILRNHKRLRIGFDQRLVPTTWPTQSSLPTDAPIFWILAASGGESTLIAPLITALLNEYKEQFPASPLPLFLCTTCTAQGMEIINKQRLLFPQNVQHRIVANYFPLDAPNIMRKAIKQTNPTLVILLETELWPGFIHELKCAHIPYAIVNGRMTEKTFHTYSKAKSFFTSHKPLRIFATTQDNAQRFSHVFEQQVECISNIKFDNIYAELTHTTPPQQTQEYTRLTSILSLSKDTTSPLLPPCVALASLRQEEEELLFPLVKELSQTTVQDISLLCCIAPRHQHRIEAWAQWLHTNAIPFVRKSDLNEALPKDIHCILWDTFGELTTLYALADMAFVGGSLAPLGGQNFLESLAQGTTTYIGPSWTNFAWAGTDFFHEDILTQQDSATSLALTLQKTFRKRFAPPLAMWNTIRKEKRTTIRSHVLSTIRQSAGGSQKTAQALLAAIQQP